MIFGFIARLKRQDGVNDVFEVFIFGEYQDISPIIESTTTALAQQVVSQATTLWGNGERMTKILIFGGGAARLGSAIRAAFPRNGVILSHPAIANALGFSYFAQRNIFSNTENRHEQNAQ